MYSYGMTHFFLSSFSWLWLTLMIVFVLIEAFTMAFTTIWAAIAALPMIFIARTSLPFRWQILIFLVLTIFLVLSTRPFAIKKLKMEKEKTNINSIAGEEVIVTKAVRKFQKGEAKAKNGVIWAVSSEDSSEIPEDTVSVVTGVQGNTLIIKPKIKAI